jgi:hypothetical protein
LGALPSSRRGYVLEYYLLGENPLGAVVGGLRDRADPLRVPVEGDRGGWYRRWWIWTLAGVVTAGAIATGVVLGTRPAPDARLVGP